MTNRPILLVLCIALFTSAALAQTGTSSISGTITDTTGAVIPGATVTVTNENTGLSYRQTTTDSGVFSFTALPAGPYTVTVEAQGFKTSKRTKNTLVVETPLTVDISLAVGETTEVVNVEATAETVQTSNATIGNVVTQKAITDLPLNGRNPFNFLVLEPGVVQRSYGGVGSGIHVNGARDRSSNVTIDGIEANESTVPNPLANLYRLNPDNVQEYKVTTSNATPEEGRNAGANIAVATRTGTNSFHGTVFEFLRNTAFNANEFFSNAQGTSRNEIKLNQYGFEVGGPIVKNKTFFFAGWAGQKINFAQPIDQTYGLPYLYTPAAASGIFRYWVPDTANPLVINGTKVLRNTPLLVDANGNYVTGVHNCANAAEKNCVASYNMYANDPRQIGIDPQVAKLIASFPKPNSFLGGDGLNTGTYFWNPPTQVRGPNWMARVDHQFNENNALFGRFLYADQNTLEGDPLNSRPAVYPGFPPEGEVFRASKNAALSYRRVFSPRVVNEFTAGMARFIFLFTQGEANPAWPNVPPYARASIASGGSGFNNLDIPYLNTPRTYRSVTTPQIIDNLSIVKASHVIRTGFNIRSYRHNDQRGQPGGVNVTPALTFDSNVRSVSNVTAPGIDATDQSRLLGAMNDLLGIPSRLTQVFLGDLKSDTFLPFRTGNTVTLWNEGQRLKQYDLYAQDEWKVKRNLTINYGARWEINPAPSEAGGRVYVPDKSILGDQGLVTFVHADRWFKNNNIGAIAPRLGITYSPGSSGKTVIRAGYGMAFDTLSSFQVTAVAGKVPGLTTQCQSVPGGSTTPGCTAVPDVRLGEGFPSELPVPSVKPSSFLTAPIQLLSSAPTLTVFDQNLKAPTIHQWNVNLQRELPGGFLAQVGYVASRGTRLYRAYDVNQINADGILPMFRALQANLKAGCAPSGSGCPSGVTPVAITGNEANVLSATFLNSSTTRTDLQRNAAGNFAGRVEQTTLAFHLRHNQQFGTITYLDSGGDSYYHSMQARVLKRFSGGLLFGAAYTLAHSIDDQSVDPVGASSGGGLSATTSRAPADVRDWKLERASSDFDRRHVFTSNWIYDLPFGRGKRFAGSAHGLGNQIIGGWTINGLFTAMTGEPFSVRSGARTSDFSHESRAALVDGLPEAKLQEYGSQIGPRIFGPDALEIGKVFNYPDPGSTGMPRNLFRGPGYWNLDSSVSKRFPITERVDLQFRAEAFNVLNHANFDNPRDASVGSPAINSTQFARVCCAAVAPPSTQYIIQTGEAARVLQFALKLNF